MNQPHIAHNNTRESPRYIFTIFTIILLFFKLFKIFKSSITPLILIFITYYYFSKKDPIFKANFIYIFFKIILVTLFFSFLLCLFFNIVFLKIQPLLQIFNLWSFCSCYQFYTFKNPIFSIHFYLGVRLLAWLLSPPLDSPFSPPGRLCLLPPPSLLYPILCISLCSRRWRTLRELITGWICLSPFHFPLLSSWPPLSPSSLYSSLYNSMNISERSRLWSARKEVITG